VTVREQSECGYLPLYHDLSIEIIHSINNVGRAKWSLHLILYVAVIKNNGKVTATVKLHFVGGVKHKYAPLPPPAPLALVRLCVAWLLPPVWNLRSKHTC